MVFFKRHACNADAVWVSSETRGTCSLGLQGPVDVIVVLGVVKEFWRGDYCAIPQGAGSAGHGDLVEPCV